jgi:hypothetical protein
VLGGAPAPPGPPVAPPLGIESVASEKNFGLSPQGQQFEGTAAKANTELARKMKTGFMLPFFTKQNVLELMQFCYWRSSEK